MNSMTHNHGQEQDGYITYHRRPHQELAISSILSGFKRHARGQFISACGTGKTVSCLWVKEDLDAQRTLVLVPSLALIDQYASEWREHQAPELRYATLCVCSDNTVGQADEDYDSIDLTPDDLKHDGFEVTSDQSRIAAFMRQGGRQVIFSTYQSSHLIEAAQADESIPPFDLAIADEAHRCAGDKNSLFAIILDGDRIRAKRRLFATATPRIHGLKKGQEEAAADLVDMSDEARFGTVFHTLTMGEAIKKGLLSDYRVAIMAIHESDLSIGADDKNKAQQAVQVGVLKAIREYGLRRVISFHSFVKNADEFAQALPEVAAAMWPGEQQTVRPVADFVSGEMTSQVRKQKMAAFRSVEPGQCRILSNARCLTEGVDVPDIDGIAFIDPRGSTIDIVQALGRAIRKHEGKTHGTIILPVFMGKGETPGEAIENSNFKTVYGVLNALRAHDADFETALNERRQVEGGAKPGETDPFTKILIIGMEYVAELTKILQPRLIGYLTDDWEVGFGAAKARYERYGHCDVPSFATWPEDDSDGFKLGRWIRTQRNNYRAGGLSAERKQKLESIGMTWGIKPNATPIEVIANRRLKEGGAAVLERITKTIRLRGDIETRLKEEAYLQTKAKGKRVSESDLIEEALLQLLT